MKRLLGWLGERLIVSLSVFASVGIVAALATNYTMTQGSGTTFGSIVVTAVNYPQMLLCDLTTPSQCASVSAGGAVKVDNSAVTQPSNVSQINSVTPLMGNGVTGTGSQRVTIASDNTAFAVNPASATAPIMSMNSASANSGVNAALAATFDDVAPTSITENSFGVLRMSANRNLYGTIRDAAGNERGVNVDASNRLTTAPSIVSGAVASGAYASGAFASGSIGSGAVASGAVASGAFASGSIGSGALASGSVASGAMVDLGAQADAVCGTATGTCSLIALQKYSNATNPVFGAGENHAGEFGSNQIAVQVAATVTASAYSAGNALGGLQTIAGAARVSGSLGAAGTGGIITGFNISSKSTQTGAQVDVFIFNANPSASTCTDKTAFALNTADANKVIGVITVPSTAANGAGWYAGGSGGAVAMPTYYPITFDLASATSLFACGVVRGAMTPGTTSDISYNYNILRN